MQSAWPPELALLLKVSQIGLLLESYTWGNDALRWTSLKEDEHIRFALRDIDLLHGMGRNLEKSCIGGMTHSWADDEFTSGAFAMFEPDQRTSLFQDIWKIPFLWGVGSTHHLLSPA
jgi:monoamine oxidase